MNIETYKAEFQQLQAKADKISELYYKDRADLQVGLTELSVRAVTFYSANNNYGQSDYEQRVQILLDFDNHLKEIKSKMFPVATEKKKGSQFFSAAEIQDPDENSVLLNIKEPAPRVTKH